MESVTTNNPKAIGLARVHAITDDVKFKEKLAMFVHQIEIGTYFDEISGQQDLSDQPKVEISNNMSKQECADETIKFIKGQPSGISTLSNNKPTNADANENKWIAAGVKEMPEASVIPVQPYISNSYQVKKQTVTHAIGTALVDDAINKILKESNSTYPSLAVDISLIRPATYNGSVAYKNSNLMPGENGVNSSSLSKKPNEPIVDELSERAIKSQKGKQGLLKKQDDDDDIDD